MSDPVLDVRDYAFTEEDRLLLDANVWLSIYGPDPTARRRSSAYQRAFRRMRTARNQLFTDVLVLSEFINRFARQLYVQQWPRGHPAVRPALPAGLKRGSGERRLQRAPGGTA